MNHWSKGEGTERKKKNVCIKINKSKSALEKSGKRTIIVRCRSSSPDFRQPCRGDQAKGQGDAWADWTRPPHSPAYSIRPHQPRRLLPLPGDWISAPHPPHRNAPHRGLCGLAVVLGAACHVQTFRSPAADGAFAERRSCRCLAFQKHLPEPPKVKSEVHGARCRRGCFIITRSCAA